MISLLRRRRKQAEASAGSIVVQGARKATG